VKRVLFPAASTSSVVRAEQVAVLPPDGAELEDDGHQEPGPEPCALSCCHVVAQVAGKAASKGVSTVAFILLWLRRQIPDGPGIQEQGKKHKTKEKKLTCQKPMHCLYYVFPYRDLKQTH
jgi:hypothetical protein